MKRSDLIKNLESVGTFKVEQKKGNVPFMTIALYSEGYGKSMMIQIPDTMINEVFAIKKGRVCCEKTHSGVNTSVIVFDYLT